MNEICKNAVIFLYIFLLIGTNAVSYDEIEGYVPEEAKKRFGKGYIFDFDYSPDGSMLTYTNNDTIFFLDIKSGEVLKTIKGHNGRLFGLSFSKDGNLLASVCNRRNILIWDLPTLFLQEQ